MQRIHFCSLIAICVFPTILPSKAAASEDRPPNFVVIFCDDLGYGDLGCYGSVEHHTPYVDRMAEGGMRFTNFYATAPVCTPSRSSLLTGCYPRRVSMHVDHRGAWVLFPVSPKGLNHNEVTIAERLKDQGYATTAIGKWHLGDQREFLPVHHGFDTYYGLPYSNDMVEGRNERNPPLPLVRNEKVIEAPVNQNTLTQRYTEQAIEFIEHHQDQPFFVYLPHTMPHNPVHASDRFDGLSRGGDFGDSVEEIDWSTGQILEKLDELGLQENTLVVFTSDNGGNPRWGASNDPLRGSKGSTWEGGMREPAIFYWPRKIPAGRVCHELATTMDLMPTLSRLAGTEPPQDRIIDGHDIRSLLFAREGAQSPYTAFYYYKKENLEAVRSGPWKLRFVGGEKLYNLDQDLGETTDVADQHPQVVERLKVLADWARHDIGDGDQEGENQRPAMFVDQAEPLARRE